VAHGALDRAEAKLADPLQRDEKLPASFEEAHANLARARVEIGQRDQELAAMRASRSWRITKPLRMVRHHLRKVFLSFAAK